MREAANQGRAEARAGAAGLRKGSGGAAARPQPTLPHVGVERRSVGGRPAESVSVRLHHLLEQPRDARKDVRVLQYRAAKRVCSGGLTRGGLPGTREGKAGSPPTGFGSGLHAHVGSTTLPNNSGQVLSVSPPARAPSLQRLPGCRPGAPRGRGCTEPPHPLHRSRAAAEGKLEIAETGNGRMTRECSGPSVPPYGSVRGALEQACAGGARAAGRRTVLWQHGHAQAGLVQLHPPPVVVLPHALHRGLVQLQVGAKGGCDRGQGRGQSGPLHHCSRQPCSARVLWKPGGRAEGRPQR